MDTLGGMLLVPEFSKTAVHTVAVYDEEAELIWLETNIPGPAGPAIRLVGPDVIFHLNSEGTLRSMDFLNFGKKPGALKPIKPDVQVEGAMVFRKEVRGQSLVTPQRTLADFDPLHRTLAICFSSDVPASYAGVGKNLLIGLDADYSVCSLFLSQILDMRTYEAQKSRPD